MKSPLLWRIPWRMSSSSLLTPCSSPENRVPQWWPPPFFRLERWVEEEPTAWQVEEERLFGLAPCICHETQANSTDWSEGSATSLRFFLAGSVHIDMGHGHVRVVSAVSLDVCSEQVKGVSSLVSSYWAHKRLNRVKATESAPRSGLAFGSQIFH